MSSNKILEIKENDVIFARYIPSEVAWQKGLNFFSNDSDFIQAGTWGYDKGIDLRAHIHNEVSRDVSRTQEILFVKRGSIKAVIYNLERNKIAEIIIYEGDIIILLKGGHGYEILEDHSQVLEIKNGPYLGREIDRVRI